MSAKVLVSLGNVHRVLLLSLLGLSAASAVEVNLPTDNAAIYNGGGAQFYQYVERNFGGVKSYPWEGGQYGFVRDPRAMAGGIVYRKFHEGIDVKPLRRDARGVPLDEVRAVAAGEVVHVSTIARHSNYGCYVVIRHIWGGCPYYTLYAHLNEVLVQAGQKVGARQTVGILGFTGRGIDLSRAHLHFEVNLLLSNRFEEWSQKYFKHDPNKHGLYNGQNLAGLDAAAFLKRNHANPNLSVPDFLKSAEVFYRVRVPAPGPVGLARRYPWMAEGYRGGPAEISFTRSGLPVKIETSQTMVSQPLVTWFKRTAGPLREQTKGYLRNVGAGAATLSDDGLHYMELICWP